MFKGSPKIIVTIIAIVNIIYLICAMVLFSSIIAWLSLEFTAALPAAMAFIVGTLCLVTAILGTIMFGGKDTRDLFTALFILFSVFVLLASIGLLPPFTSEFYSSSSNHSLGETCSDCSELYGNNASVECVRDCNDECCFTDFSSPLVRLLFGFVIVALVVSFIGIFVGAIHCYFVRRDYSKDNNTQ